MSTAPAPSAPGILSWERAHSTQPKNIERLHNRVKQLRERHGDAFLPAANTPEEMLTRFCELIFPPGRLSDFLVSNITTKDQPYLMIRPLVLLPSHVAHWPARTSLAAKGYVDPRTGLFRLMDIADMPMCDARPFERPLRAVPIQGYLRGADLESSVLRQDWLQALPLISGETAKALRNWNAYLDWKERLVKAGIGGVRYVSRALQPDGRWQFVIAVPGKDKIKSVERLLRSDNLCAYGLDYSTDPWEFKYREESKSRAQALGDNVDRVPKLLGPAGVAGLPPLPDMPDAQILTMSYGLDDDLQARFSDLIDSEGPEHAVDACQSAVPETGFLALSAVGDFALIRRQREELQRMQRESGFAPFVSAYLFDIRQAAVPAARRRIADGEWLRSDLNRDQQDAVELMISTPEISLVQGPPGTGKTTMIAEAIYQLTRDGKKILVASQANLAVDNALERLADVPSIRAVRLGAKADKESPFGPDRALATYYRSIAGDCQRRVVDRWNERLRNRRELADWIENCELIKSDIEQTEMRMAAARALEARESERVRTTEGQLEQALAHGARLADADEFVEKLSSAQETWAGRLPSPLHASWFAPLKAIQSLLSSAHLKAGAPVGQYDAASPIQPTLLFDVASAAQALDRRLPALVNELERLERLQDEQLMSAETERRIAELEAEKKRLWARFEEGDESVGPRVRAIRQEVQELARNSGLSRELYQAVFDEDAAEQILSANTVRESVLVFLREAIAAVGQTAQSLHGFIDLARNEVGRAREQAASPASIEHELATSRSALRELQYQLHEDERKHAHHLGDLAQHLNAAATDGNWRQHCEQALQVRRAGLDALSGELQRDEQLRNDWSPVLSAWLDNLREQGAVAPDVPYLSDAFLQSCNVVGVTCSERRRTLEDAKQTYFDVAIIDEVSKATPPELLMAVSMARSAILVGDHRQLPPVFKEGIGAKQYLEQLEDEGAEPAEDGPAESRLTEENLARYEDMVSASLFKKHFEAAPDALKAFLFTQYRMHPQIMEVVNPFYEQRLTCGLADPDGLDPKTPQRDVRQHRLRLTGPGGIPYLEPDQHVLWIDSGKTPDDRDAYERKVGVGGKVNDTEAALIAKTLADLDDAHRKIGYGVAGKKPKQVGVVTFYGQQSKAIRKAIEAMVAQRGPFVAIKHHVNTADRYQGKEAPIIIVSLVRCPKHKLSDQANTAQFERINVAFSRAQELLIIMGAVRTFRDYDIELPHLDCQGSSRKKVYGQIIGEIERNAGLKQARQLITSADYASLLPAQAAEPDGPIRKNRGTVRHSKSGGAA